MTVSHPVGAVGGAWRGDASVAERWFPGGGEMAARCRAFDWGGTPLGEPATWSPVLRSTVATVLAARMPMVLFWGPEGIVIYNDAFRPSLGIGGRHPASLGLPAADCFADLWDRLGPRLEAAWRHAEASWHESEPMPLARNGVIDDVYWSSSCSPVLEADGRVAGVLLSCVETTATVVAERFARGLADRLTVVLESISDAVFTIDRQWRFTYLNSEAERLLERQREALLGVPVWEAFPDAVGSRFYHEYHRAFAEDVVVRFEEYYPPLQRWMTVTAYPSPDGLTVYFQDATALRTMHEQLREREQMLSVVSRMASVGGWRVDLATKVTTWTDETCDIHGVPRGTNPTLEQAMRFYPPDSRRALEERFARCVEQGTPYDVILQVRRTDGRLRWVRAIGEAVRDGNGRIVGVQGAFQDIQGQKDAEEALADSERRFRHLADSMPLIVWTASADGRITFNSRNLEQYSAVTAPEVEGDRWMALVHPDDLVATRKTWSQAVLDGTPYQTQFRIRRADGAWRWHLVRAVPVRQVDGRVKQWFGSATDVHDQLETQRDAVAAAQRITATLESITDAFYLLTPDWRFAFVNAEAERVLQQPPGSLTGRVLWDVFPDVRGSALDLAYRRAIELGETASMRFFYPTLGRWFDVRAYPSQEGLAVYFRDVSADLQAEARLREQAALLDLAQDAILVRGLDGRVEFWNDGAARLYGWGREEAIGRPDAALLGAEDPAHAVAAEAVLAGGEWVGELEHRRRDGSVVIVEAHWTLVRDDDGAPARILAIHTDITERKQLMAQFLRAQRMESIGTLAGGIAHDLNNVLAPILMSIEYLRETVEDATAQEVLGTIEASAQRGAAMVRQVLGFARGFDRSDDTVSVHALVDELLKVVRDTFPKDIAVRTDLAEDVPPLRGDRTQLEQVLMNLLVNARDAMPGGGLISVTAEAVSVDAQFAAMTPGAAAGLYIRLTVQDTGSGIPPHVLARIFDPFFTTKAPGKGTGLGLATVASIMKSHGGFAHVASEPGEGTTFRLFFPVRDPRRSGDQPVVETGAPRGNGELVLLVDDESAIREVSRQTLEQFGYRVVTANDGAEAMATFAARRDEIAVVITDMVMPVMDGATLIRALRHLAPDVRIVGASGLGAEGGTVKVGDAGLRHFLAKPYSADALLRTLRDALAS